MSIESTKPPAAVGSLADRFDALRAKLPELPAISALKTQKAGIIALASTVAGITVILNHKSIQSGVSSFFKKVKATAKAAKQSVSAFLNNNDKAVKVTAAVVGAGILATGSVKLLKSRQEAQRQAFLNDPTNQAVANGLKHAFPFNQKIASALHFAFPGPVDPKLLVSPVLGMDTSVADLATKLGQSFPGTPPASAPVAPVVAPVAPVVVPVAPVVVPVAPVVVPVAPVVAPVATASRNGLAG